MYSLDHLKLVVFGDAPRRHPKSSSENGLQLRPLADQSVRQALFKSVKSKYTRHFPLFFFTTTILATIMGRTLP